MTVSTLKKPMKSPVRERATAAPALPKGLPPECDTEFYSSLGHLRETLNRASWLGYDFSRRRSSTQEERDLHSVVSTIKPVPQISVNPPTQSDTHKLFFRRSGNMRNASSICSLPAYLAEESGKEFSTEQQRGQKAGSVTTAESLVESPQRNFVTVNYQSTKTLLGRKRSFRGKKVLRCTNKDAESRPADTDTQRRRPNERDADAECKPHQYHVSFVCEVKPPRGLRVTKHADNTATLYWTPPQESRRTETTEADVTEPDILGYTVYVNDEVEAFVEGRRTCSLELVELERGKLYRTFITSRGAQAESSASVTLQFVMPNTRIHTHPGQAYNKAGNLSMSMPTLLGEQDDSSGSEYCYDLQSTSPDSHHEGLSPYPRHSDSSSSRSSDGWMSENRLSLASSGLGTSTPSSPQTDVPMAYTPGETNAAPDSDWEQTRKAFHFLSIPGLGAMQDRPVSAEPHLHAAHSNGCQKSRQLSVSTLAEPRPASAPGVRRKVAFFCTAV